MKPDHCPLVIKYWTCTSQWKWWQTLKSLTERGKVAENSRIWRFLGRKPMTSSRSPLKSIERSLSACKGSSQQINVFVGCIMEQINYWNYWIQGLHRFSKPKFKHFPRTIFLFSSANNYFYFYHASLWLLECGKMTQKTVSNRHSPFNSHTWWGLLRGLPVSWSAGILFKSEFEHYTILYFFQTSSTFQGLLSKFKDFQGFIHVEKLKTQIQELFKPVQTLWILLSKCGGWKPAQMAQWIIT